jgi:hypothetical protein
MSVVLRRGGLSRRARLKFRFDFPHTKFPPHLHRKSTLRDPRNTISSISNPKRLRRVQHGHSPPLCGQTRCSGVTRFFAAVSRVWGFLPPVFPRIFNPGSKFFDGKCRDGRTANADVRSRRFSCFWDAVGSGYTLRCSFPEISARGGIPNSISCTHLMTL